MRVEVQNEGIGMTCSRTSPRGPVWMGLRRMVRGLIASAGVGTLLASCSVVMSFETHGARRRQGAAKRRDEEGRGERETGRGG